MHLLRFLAMVATSLTMKETTFCYSGIIIRQPYVRL